MIISILIKYIHVLHASFIFDMRICLFEIAPFGYGSVVLWCSFTHTLIKEESDSCYTVTPCIGETPKRVLLQTVKTTGR